MKSKKIQNDFDDMIDYDNETNKGESDSNLDTSKDVDSDNLDNNNNQKEYTDPDIDPEEKANQLGSTNKSKSSDSKFFAIRITGGQENIVANVIQNKINSKKIDLYSVLILEHFKGYVIVEAPDSNIAYEALYGIRHVRGQIRGDLPFSDIEKYLVKKPVVTELNIDDTVEVIAGPFKSMKAKITRVDYEKQEVTVLLLDSPYQIPVTVDANYLKKTIS